MLYGKINRGQVSRPLYRGCPLFGGSVIRCFTVYCIADVTACTACFYVFSHKTLQTGMHMDV